ncbi:hypothetical protein Tco_0615145 [Tanacetum coccineum]
MDLNFVVDGDLRELSVEEALETIKNFSQGQKEWDKPFKAITEQELASLRAQANELFGNEKVWFEMPREDPSFVEPKPQPQPLPNCPSLDVSLGDERGPEPPIKPLSPDSFRMEVVKDGVVPSVTGDSRNAAMKVDTPSMVEKTVEKENLSLVINTSDLGSYPPLTMQETTSAGNAPGKSSYANVTGKPSGT